MTEMTPAEWHNWEEYEADQMIVQEVEFEEEAEREQRMHELQCQNYDFERGDVKY